MSNRLKTLDKTANINNSQINRQVSSDVLFHLVFNASHLKLSKRLSASDVTEQAMKRMMRR